MFNDSLVLFRVDLWFLDGHNLNITPHVAACNLIAKLLCIMDRVGFSIEAVEQLKMQPSASVRKRPSVCYVRVCVVCSSWLWAHAVAASGVWGSTSSQSRANVLRDMPLDPSSAEATYALIRAAKQRTSRWLCSVASYVCRSSDCRVTKRSSYC